MIKGFVLWKDSRRIKEIPKSENFIYYAYEWIKATFPEFTINDVGNQRKTSMRSMSGDSSDLESTPFAPLLSRLHELIVDYSNGLKISQRPRYRDFREETEMTLAISTTRKILSNS